MDELLKDHKEGLTIEAGKFQNFFRKQTENLWRNLHNFSSDSSFGTFITSCFPMKVADVILTTLTQQILHMKPSDARASKSKRFFSFKLAFF